MAENVAAAASTAPSSPEKRKRLQLWSSRRLSGLRRSKSSPIVQVKMETSPEAKLELTREEEHEREEEHGDALGLGNGAKDVFHNGNGAWADDAASTHTAFREDISKFEGEGEWAQNLFYAYARRTDDPRFSRFLLTFSSALVCAEWWSLIQQHFGGTPANTREGAQFFSFTGDDIAGRAWKHQAFTHLRTKWMYSQIGDAVGAMGKGQEIIPLQDERGFPMQSAGAGGPRATTPDLERAPSRAGSFAESLGQREKEFMAKQLRRTSKRDSGILLPSSPLVGASHERSHSMPMIPPDSGGGGSSTGEKSFDFERMEQNLARIEKMMESNASQLRSLEHVQAANLERLTAALLSNAEMIRELGSGQQKLGEACADLRKAVRERDERSEKMSLRSIGSVGSMGSAGSCEHAVKKGPRKLGRTVVGYIYADEPDGSGTKTIVSARER